MDSSFLAILVLIILPKSGDNGQIQAGTFVLNIRMRYTSGIM